MGFKCGIVGLPNVGKSTLFNALTETAAAQAANYPFCTIEPNIGNVAVPDPRLQTIAKIGGSQKIIDTQLGFVDIAGLVRGASKGEGLGNQFLGNIREVDAIVHVLRCFEDDDIQHVDNKIDPISDAETVEVADEDLRRIHAITAAQRRELLELLSSGVEELDDIPVAAGLIHVGADKADAPFGAYVTELDEELAFEHEEDDDYEDDLLAAECIFVGHAWDRPQQFGTCFYHCRDHGELDDEESGLDLDELLATRKEALWRAVTMRDAQEGAAPTESAAAAATAGAAAVAAGAAAAPSVLAQLWDEQDEGRAARTLLSFAAAATLGPLERLEALLMTDASNRLQFALEKLSEQQETLASMLVLVKKEAARSGRF